MAEVNTGATAEGLADRVFEAVLGVMDLYAMYVGDRLSYYDILAEKGSLTSGQLSALATTDERYTREWLEQQAVSGIVTVEESEDGRVFELPAGFAEALTRRQSLSYVQALSRQVLVAGFKLREIADAHRSGGGVSWGEYGDEMRDAQGDINRPVLENLLGQEWFAGVPELKTSLDGGARVADIGCGQGWSAIGLATVYEDITVDGFDIDEPSIVTACQRAEAAGIADRVRFHVVDAGQTLTDETFDIVMAIETIHDLPDPVATLSTMKRISTAEGIVVVADVNVADTFDPDAGDLERLMYGFSNFICLPDSKAHDPSVATGTVMRRTKLQEYAESAGFTVITDLPIDPSTWRFYRLD